jgi:Cytochrome c7 and related cytochrome c
MGQIFHPSMNTVSRVTIFGSAFILGGICWALWVYYRSAYQTQVGVVRSQPVQFSHEHHVGGLGIDCRYCHTSVETSPFAGIPATEICMQCHSQIWADSPKLHSVRESFRTGKSIEWTRVHDLPDFVNFDHSIHIKKGVGCISCHGRVDTMPLMWRNATLFMQWCIECHRDPGPSLRPASEVFSMSVTKEDAASAKQLLEAHRVSSETNCSVCHY